jgi:hypothetical protein
LPGHIPDRLRANAHASFTTQRFAAELEQNPTVLGVFFCFHGSHQSRNRKRWQVSTIPQPKRQIKAGNVTVTAGGAQSIALLDATRAVTGRAMRCVPPAISGRLPKPAFFGCHFCLIPVCFVVSSQKSMAAGLTDATYIVWGEDHVPYGPVELPTLVSWIKDERITSDTWLFVNQHEAWQKAAELPELQLFFRPKRTAASANVAAAQTLTGLDPRALRRVKVLAGMTEEQLEQFARFMEAEKIPQWSVVVKQGDPGDAMYMILEGEFRVRTSIAGRETILATLGVGEFFGDIALFDHGPRAADVVANTEGLLLKVSAAAFGQLAREAPELAAALLLEVGKTLSARIRTDNKRFGDMVKFARAAD